MSQKGPFFDYVIIVLLGLGVTLLGVHDLSERQKGFTDGTGKESVLQALKEDFSTQLAEGEKVEKLTPLSEQEVKARYPWKATVEKQNPEEETFLARMWRIVFGDSTVE